MLSVVMVADPTSDQVRATQEELGFEFCVHGGLLCVSGQWHGGCPEGGCGKQICH
jgi:hypothetical protein